MLKLINCPCEVKLSFYRKFSFWFILAILFLAAFFFLEKTFSSVKVKTYSVKKQEFLITVTATSTGTIKSDKEVKITAQRTGKIEKLFVEEGHIVKPGSMIVELDADEASLNLKIAQASLDKAIAVQKETESRLKRFIELKEKGFVSQGEVDSVLREYDVAKAALIEAENSLSLAKLNYDYSFIKSPINGVVTSKPVELGETVTKGALIANVVSTEALYIEAFIDEADVGKVKKGQEVHITMDAYPEQVFTGEIYMISPVVLGGKQETRTFETRTRFKEKGVVVKPGMSADIEIIVERAEDVLTVPSQAIIERNGKKNIFVKSDSKARLVPIEIGRFNWTYTEVLKGINEGDAIIISPDVQGLADGKRIKESHD